MSVVGLLSTYQAVAESRVLLTPDPSGPAAVVQDAEEVNLQNLVSENLARGSMREAEPPPPPRERITRHR